MARRSCSRLCGSLQWEQHTNPARERGKSLWLERQLNISGEDWRAKLGTAEGTKADSAGESLPHPPLIQCFGASDPGVAG